MPPAAAGFAIRRPLPSAARFAPLRAPTKLSSVSQELLPDDGELMLRYGAGDAAAFEVLYARHRAALWRFLLRSLDDEHAAADIFQETWVRVIAHRERYAVTARFKTWLYRIAHNCCVDHWRRVGRLTRREQRDAEEMLESLAGYSAQAPDEYAESAEQADALQAALRELPEAQRLAFLLYVDGDLGLADIATTTGVGVETAKSRLRYAVARLRKALDGR
jgi:RNA polymerase sigma-70 factor (ECF subfamily)